MAFQFQCPRGHLLTGEESQAGQQSLCPMCGVLFIVPLPMGYASGPPTPYFSPPAPPLPASPYPQPAMANPAIVEPELMPRNPFEALKSAVEAAEAAQATTEAPEQETPADAPAKPILLHIPCPQGHLLETPEEMLDQEVLCPHCQSQFVLRQHNSVEHKRQKEEDERIREIKTGNLWLNWAIVVVVLVVLGLVTLIVMRHLMQTPVTD